MRAIRLNILDTECGNHEVIAFLESHTLKAISFFINKTKKGEKRKTNPRHWLGGNKHDPSTAAAV
jgi:hypothetical protein